MPTIIAIYGSPRRKGNTAELMKQAVAGARQAGASVEEVILRDLKISPCLEIYQCKKSGRCAIKDDFHQVVDQLMAADAVMLASPIFFYTVSAQTKILMDRCQSLWVRKYWLDQAGRADGRRIRNGLFISVGATKGRRLFDGALLTVRYFFDAVDIRLWKSLLYRNLDQQGAVLEHQDYLDQAHAAGAALAAAIPAPRSTDSETEQTTPHAK